jgi:hypothetical protein
VKTVGKRGTVLTDLSMLYKRPITAKVVLISLGYTVLIDSEKHEVIVPNSVMMSCVVIRLGKVVELLD